MKNNQILAMKNLQRVDFESNHSTTNIDDWNWTPEVSNINSVKEIIASGSSTTTRNTYSTQQDHGESY